MIDAIKALKKLQLSNRSYALTEINKCVSGMIFMLQITPCSFYVICRSPISRRELHLMTPSKGRERRKYGGTTTSFNIRKGDLVRYKDKLGYCSGYTGKSILVSDANWKRLGRYAVSKIELVMRSMNLICKNIIGGAQFRYAQA